MKIENISATRGHNKASVLVELSFEGVPPETAIARVLAILGREEAEQPAPAAPVEEDEHDEEAAKRAEAEETPTAEPARRRRGNALGEPETKPEVPATTEGRRRRRSEGQSDAPLAAAPSAEAGPTNLATAQVPAVEQPSRRRRSEGQSDAPLAAAATADPSTISASPAPASPEQPSRRRRSSAPAESSGPTSAEATKSAPSSPAASDISDADLYKAASEAARVLTPTVVRAYLDEFGAETTGKLKGEQRREFIDGLKAKLAEEGAK